MSFVAKLDKDGNLLCLDAKIGFEDNALFRHPDVEALRDIHEEDALEVEASEHSRDICRTWFTGANVGEDCISRGLKRSASLAPRTVRHRAARRRGGGGRARDPTRAAARPNAVVSPGVPR